VIAEAPAKGRPASAIAKADRPYAEASAITVCVAKG
jgi:hypothetical protein